MKNQDLQGISVARSVVSYRVYHNHEEDDMKYYSNIQIMQDMYVWTIAKTSCDFTIRHLSSQQPQLFSQDH